MSKTKYLIIGFLAGVLAFPGAALAAKTFNVTPFSVRFIVNGKTHNPDASQQAFSYNGTTYVPIRYLGTIMDKSVRYDSAIKTIYITDKTTTETPVNYHNGELYKMLEIEQFNAYRKPVSIDGTKYTETIVLEPKGKIVFRLDGKFKKITFLSGFADSAYTGQSGGEIIVTTDNGKSHIVPNSIDSDPVKTYSYDVTGAKTITFYRSGEKAHGIIVNGKLE